MHAALAAAPAPPPPTLADEVAWLRRPASYPGEVAAVEAVETHMSWVFLAGDRAYKLKKPVRTAFLDYASVEARRRCCGEEVSLNQRLAPGVYLGCTPLVRAGSQLALGGDGEVVDWLVVMRRLPRERMLDRRLETGGPRLAELRRLSDLLNAFYARATRPPLGEQDLRQRLAGDAELHCRQLAAAGAGVLPAAVLDRLAGDLAHFVGAEGPLLAGRVRDGRVVDGHGDLRPEHVCLLRIPVVIDCLEFDPALRRVDAVEELAYLSLECARRGGAWVGAHLLASYRERCADPAPPRLVCFYQALRATLRAKLALWHVAPPVDGDGPWTRLAREYVALAARYAAAARGG